jgi:hypothetical protein
MSIDATPRMNAVLPAPFLAAHNSLLAELYVQAKASRWSLSREEFNAALYRSAVHRFGALLPRDYTVEFYLRSLHSEDFAFACALHRGTAWAWEQFFGHYRPSLYSDSAAMAGSQGEAYARELVDAFYDELHPVGPDGDEPDRSGLRDYHGRSKLATWLRVSIAERHVDSTALSGARETEAARRIKKPTGPLRSSRHFRRIRQPLARFDPLRAPYLATLRQAFDDAIAALAASDRLFAALYCAEQLDRSQMAQLQGVPEITISRRLADIRASCTPRSRGYWPPLPPPLGRRRTTKSAAPSHPRRLTGASHTLLKIGNLKSTRRLPNPAFASQSQSVGSQN